MCRYGNTNSCNPCHTGFAEFDADGNGYLSKNEFLHFLEKKAHKKYSREDALRLFAKYDANGDGRIDLSEFTKLIESGELDPPQAAFGGIPFFRSKSRSGGRSKADIDSFFEGFGSAGMGDFDTTATEMFANMGLGGSASSKLGGAGAISTSTTVSSSTSADGSKIEVQTTKTKNADGSTTIVKVTTTTSRKGGQTLVSKNTVRKTFG